VTQKFTQIKSIRIKPKEIQTLIKGAKQSNQEGGRKTNCFQSQCVVAPPHGFP